MIRQLAVVHTECCCSCGTCQCAILQVWMAVSWRLEWGWFYICLQMIYSGNISHECCEIRTRQQFVHSLQKQRKAICRTGKTCLQNLLEVIKQRGLIQMTVFRVLTFCSTLDWQQSSSKMSVSPQTQTVSKPQKLRTDQHQLWKSENKRAVKLFHNIVNPLMNGPTVNIGGSIMPTVGYFQIIDIYSLKHHQNSNAIPYK
jgi:hypothetical protein